MATNNAATTGTVAVPVTPDKALEMYRGMVTAIPEAPESDGSELIAQILMSTDISDSMETSGLPAGKDLIDRRLRVESVLRYPSDMEGGLGWYLVADATDVDTGEQVRFQTSAGSLMAWLVKLHFSDAFPAVIQPTATETRKGRTAVSCRVLSASGPLKALASA